ncbi:MAG: hypothetical protein JWP89_251 [Schlesneria sp.]|nr:hypothetical protein [Schlesneria sp.]
MTYSRLCWAHRELGQIGLTAAVTIRHNIQNDLWATGDGGIHELAPLRRFDDR